MLDTGSSIDVESSSGASSDVDTDVLLEATSGAFRRDPGLGLLLEMARRGEYDPWDIDIVALTDRYLAALDEQLDARDLTQVARLIFCAAALVRLKAQALAERERARRQADAGGGDGQPQDDLEALLGGRRGLLPGDLPLLYPDVDGDDRGVALGLVPRERRPRERGLTLVDLISALRGYDERIAQRELEEAEAFDVSSITVDDCVHTVHEDHLDQDIIGVRDDLAARFPGGPAVDLEALVTATRSRAASYLALLFLAQEEEVLLEQTVFYGALTIRPGAHWGEVRAGVRAVDADEVAAGSAVATQEADADAGDEDEDEDAVLDLDEDEGDEASAEGGAGDEEDAS